MPRLIGGCWTSPPAPMSTREHEGLEEARLGKGRSADDFFAEFEVAHVISG
jgi:hypothetical protein